MDIVLSNTAKIGDVINVKESSDKFKVVGRKILDDFGILFVLEDSEGNKLEHVFYD